MSARLIEALATTGPLADVFADESVLRAMLDFEAALARAESRAGLIPESAARAITSAAQPANFDIPALAQDSLRAGTPGIAVSKALSEVVRRQDAAAAGYVHWGATSQDVVDTALVLLLKRAQPILAADLQPLEGALARLSEEHARTVMLGRTLMQPAPPVTFGLKAAQWLNAIHRSRRELEVAFNSALVLQFGGASGTLASLGAQGTAVARMLAEELRIACPPSPWHGQRDRLAAVVCAAGVLTGSLGKMARDIALLMQHEVAEAAEPGGEGRGGSSTMPHKRNPIACSLTLAAANRVPGLVASFLSAMLQEHERGAGGWQAEWSIVSSVVQATGLAASSMAEVAEGLSVDPQRMRANIESTNGLVFAERAMMLLAPKIGREEAHRLLEQAARVCESEKRRLSDVLAEMPGVTKFLDKAALVDLEDPEQYLGSAEEFRQSLLKQVREN